MPLAGQHLRYFSTIGFGSARSTIRDTAHPGSDARCLPPRVPLLSVTSARTGASKRMERAVLEVVRLTSPPAGKEESW